MALRVGLPLNGNINNYGISDVAVTNNGATVDNNGKIGKCYKCSGDSRLSFPSYTGMSMKPQNNFSVFFGAKGTTTGWLFACSAGEFRLCPTYIQIHLAGDGRYPARYNDTFNNNSGYHLGFTGSGALGKLILYLNGIEVASSDVPSSANYSIASTFNLPYDGPRYLNDFRVYDHCLSPKEVKEISKGLCLHYKLAGPSGENFILESHRVTSGGASTGITRSYTSEGYLKVVSTSGNGNWCNLGFAKDSNENVGNKLSVGDTYTISVEIKVETGTVLPTIFINAGNSYKQLKGTIKTNQGAKYSYTAVGNSPGTSYGNISLHLGFSAAIGTYYFRNFKLEKGSTATPGCPAPGDILYNALGYNNNIEDDCSGYCRHGVKSGTITWDSDSPRYTTSYKFNGSSCIKNNQFYFNSNIWTISLGYKYNTAPTAYEGIICLSKNDGSDSNKKFAIMPNSNYIWFKTESNSIAMSSLKVGEWCHLALVSNGTSAIIYENGIQKGTTAISSTVTGAYDLVVGARASSAGAATTSVYNKGNISDIRMYATALSDADIKELYNTPLSIDNVGNMYTYDFEEIK